MSTSAVTTPNTSSGYSDAAAIATYQLAATACIPVNSGPTRLMNIFGFLGFLYLPTKAVGKQMHPRSLLSKALSGWWDGS
jgi:hypothetical protein